MTGAVSALQQHPWAGIGVMLGSFLLVLAGLQLYARATAASPEATRRMLHVGAGALTLALPVLFERTWPVLLLAGASAAAGSPSASSAPDVVDGRNPPA